jgi:hypothetical protein
MVQISSCSVSMAYGRWLWSVHGSSVRVEPRPPEMNILFIGMLHLIPFKVCAAQNLGTWRCTSAPPLGMQMFVCIQLSLSVFLPHQLAWHCSATPFMSWIRVNRIAQDPIATSCFKYCVYSRFQASFEDLRGTPPSSQACFKTCQSCKTRQASSRPEDLSRTGDCSTSLRLVTLNKCCSIRSMKIKNLTIKILRTLKSVIFYMPSLTDRDLGF